MPPISSKTEKPKDTKKTVRRLTAYLLRYRYALLLALLLSVGGNLLALVGPKLSGSAINAIQGPGNVAFQRVFHYVRLMIVFYIASSLMNYLLSILMMKIGRTIARNMRNDVFDKLMKLPVGYFDRNQTGDIISRVSYDIDVINGSLSTDVVQLFSSLITVAGAFIMMLVVCPPLVIAACITIPISVVYTRHMTRKTRPMFARRSACYGKLNGFTEEMFSGQKTLQAYVHEARSVRDFDRINDEACEAFYNTEYYGTMIGPSVNFINNLSLSLVAILGSIFYMYRIVTLGDISSFVLYSRKFSGPINEVANIFHEFLSALAAAERVFRLLDEPEESPDKGNALPLKETRGDVELRDITFGYSKEKIILSNVNLRADAGKLIAIVGPTGAGKTTIINLLMRFYDPQSGQVLLDGTDHLDYTRSSLRHAYAMVLQDTWLFHGTVYDNIAYGRENATREEVVAAAKAARIHKYIMCLPKGYDTIITEDGSNISKGQKQLLTIARAMLYQSRMLILDEATSNVDTQTERQIQKAMRTLMQGKTCFVIAHRLSTIQHADRILVIDGGTIAEQGTHQELLAKKGIYYTMYQSQFQ